METKRWLVTIHQLETEVKEVIVAEVNNGANRNDIIKKLNKMINEYMKKLEGIDDIKSYENGARYWSMQYLNRYFNKVNSKKTLIVSSMMNISSNKSAPKDVIEAFKGIIQDSSFNEISSVLEGKNLDYFRRGYPVQYRYMDEVKNAMNQIVESNFGEAPVINGQRKYYGRQLFAKAERQVRYNAQMDKLSSFRNEGVRLVWVSSHANCSKRCEPWQGRLYSLDGSSGVEEGIPYIPIEKAKDVFVTTKSGKVWRNGLFGFNCRHDITKYEKNSVAPITYNKKQMEEMRQLDEMQRRFERNLYKLDMKSKIYESSGNANALKQAKEFRADFKALEKQYTIFCRKHNIPTYPDRYKTWLKA